MTSDPMDPRGPNAALIGQPGSRWQLETPALVLDLDVLDRNIATMAAHARAQNYQLRPCFKVYKSVEIARRQVAAGALGICCATLAEAECAVRAGIPSVLLFTTVVTPGKLARLAALNAVAPELIVATDDPANVADLAAAARESGRDLKVVADMDLGGGRTGAADTTGVVSLAGLMAGTPGLDYTGLQAYNGLILGIADYQTRRARSLARLEVVQDVAAALAAQGLAPRIVSGGGTGTFDIDPAAGILTEVQAGTYVLMDRFYSGVQLLPDGAAPFEQALYVHGSVVSAPGTGYIITDAGAKEIDGLFGDLQAVIASGAPDGARYSVVGDDLGRIDLPPGAASPPVGSRVSLIPPHSWQTVAFYHVYHCVSGDTLVDIWPVDAPQTW
jgi:3-hydroxy-D-aspartate aldolase